MKCSVVSSRAALASVAVASALLLAGSANRVPVGPVEPTVTLVHAAGATFTDTSAASGQTAAPAAGPARVVAGTVTSAILGESKPIYVFLPPGYDASNARYPVLYMLHGMGGSYTEWSELGLFEQAERLMQTGALSPFIIATPEGDGSYWMNWAEDGPRYRDYMVREVVAQVDAAYRTIDDPKARAVGGLSMGGTGALQLAYNHPGVFGIVGGHSPTLRTAETALAFMGSGSFFAAQDPVTLAKVSEGARYVRTWLDVGETDEWRVRVEELDQALSERKIAHEYTVMPGDHENDYWAAHGADYLRFYGRAFGAR